MVDVQEHFRDHLITEVNLDGQNGQNGAHVMNLAEEEIKEEEEHAKVLHVQDLPLKRELATVMPAEVRKPKSFLYTLFVKNKRLVFRHTFVT